MNRKLVGLLPNIRNHSGMSCVRSGEGLDPVVRNALQVGADTEGGYLVPDEFEHTLIKAPSMRRISSASWQGHHHINRGSQNSCCIIQRTASWVDEEGTINDSDDAFGQVSIGAYKLGTLIKVSEELLNDSVFPLQTYIAGEFARRIGNKEEEAFFNGDGSENLRIAARRRSDRSKQALLQLRCEVLDSIHSNPYRNKATFIMNDSTVKAIRKLKDGQGQYLWQPSLQAGTPDTILNRPLRTSSYAPAIASGAKSILLETSGHYWIADRQGRVFKRLSELYAATGKWVCRNTVDGKLTIKVLKKA